MIAENDFLTARPVEDGAWRIFRKDYLYDDNGEIAATLAKSLWIDKEFSNDYGRKAVKELFGAPIMDFPKSPFLLQRLLSIGSGPNDLVIDFFAGSATLGEAVYTANLEEGLSRQCIMVQLPEPTRRQKESGAWQDSEAFKAGFETIAELAKERLRRTAAKLRADRSDFAGDFGFRVFKLDSSNIRAWDPAAEDLPLTLESSVEHIKPDRSEQDVLFELLLKRGLELTIPIEQREIAGKTVHSIGAGTMFVCLTERIGRDDVEPLTAGMIEWHGELAPSGETQVVFLDSAFADDVAKSNLAAILEQHGLKHVRSL